MNTSRKEPFVPLTPTTVPPNERSSFRVTIVPQAANARPLASASQPSAARPAPSGAVAEPLVSLQRDGDSVSVIRVQCGCGQTIELACVYEPAVQAPVVPPPAAVPSLPPEPKPAPVLEAKGEVKRETKKTAR
jgi:hypothetical protein